MIEFQGDSAEEFLPYFEVFLEHWQQGYRTTQLNLTHDNMQKLVLIPGALEVMVELDDFSLCPDDFLALLNYDRAYGLLLQHQSKLHRASNPYTSYKTVLNATILKRAMEFQRQLYLNYPLNEMVRASTFDPTFYDR